MSIIKSEKKGDVIVVRFDEGIQKFDALITEDGKKEINAFFDKPNTKLALSLDGIRYIDSTGFGVFLSVMKTANNNYGFFKICDIAPELMELFRLLQLHNVFDLYDDLDGCLKNFN
mgnify:CR=1 FL=1